MSEEERGVEFLYWNNVMPKKLLQRKLQRTRPAQQTRLGRGGKPDVGTDYFNLNHTGENNDRS